MTRRRSPLQQLQRDAYLTSRAAGDLNALQTGGVPRLAKRVIRRQITRQGFGLLRRWT